MKKSMISLFLLLCLLCTCFLPAAATESEDPAALLQAAMEDLYQDLEIRKEYFTSGILPVMTIRSDLQKACLPSGDLAVYFTYQRDETLDHKPLVSATAQIADTIVEDYVSRRFANRNGIKEFLRSVQQEDKDFFYYADGMYYFDLKQFSGAGSSVPGLYFQGYRKLDADRYELFGYRAEFPYTPKTNDVEGKDYVILVNRYTSGGTSYTQLSYGKVLPQGVAAVAEVKDGRCAFVSFELVNNDTIPTGLTGKQETPLIEASREDICLTAKHEDVGVDVSFEIAKITSASTIVSINKALNGLGTMLLAYDLYALGSDFLPIPDFRGVAELKIQLPEGCEDPGLYFIPEDGSAAREVEGTTQDGFFLCTIEQFGTHVLVKKTAEDEPDAPEEPEIPDDPEKPDDPQIPLPSQPDTEPEAPTAPTSKPSSTRPQQQIPEPSGISATWLWVLLIILVLAMCGIGVLIVKRK